MKESLIQVKNSILSNQDVDQNLTQFIQLIRQMDQYQEVKDRLISSTEICRDLYSRTGYSENFKFQFNDTYALTILFLDKEP